jgi:hypothetical protein
MGTNYALLSVENPPNHDTTRIYGTLWYAYTAYCDSSDESKSANMDIIVSNCVYMSKSYTTTTTTIISHRFSMKFISYNDIPVF